MAQAKAISTPQVELLLTGEEANFLAGLVRHISGDPTHSKRRHADAIAQALRDIGYVRPFEKDELPVSADLHFRDE